MSKLEELIEQFCPDGVEYKTILEIATKISSGGTPRTGNQEYYTGNIPWLRTQEVDWDDITDTSVKISEDAVNNSSAKWIPANCVIVAMYGATAAKVAINKIPLTTNQACCNIEVDSKKALYRYVYYWLCNKYEKLKGMGQGSQSNINSGIIKSFPIPLPPLLVQEEIVRILDNMKSLTAELTAELSLRQKQYEHYRDSLLSFEGKDEQDGVRWMKLGEVITFLNGRAYKQPELLAEGKYKVLRVGNFYTNASWYYSNLELDDSKYCNNGDLLFTWAATLGAHIWQGDKTIFHYHIWKLVFDETILNKRYLYYFLNKDINDMKNSLTQSTMIHVSMSSMNERLIPIPSMDEQQRIASLLDRFDKLCNDISEGLPAEIEARKKQYEYYRDKLLTFKEKEA